MPYLAAAANGLFAEFGLDVELMEPAPGPENVRRVAAGGSDFCLTSVSHYLKARYQSGNLPARYVAVVVQRDPIAGLVAAGSTIRTPVHLSDARLGGPMDSGLVAEYQAGLEELGLSRSVLVPLDYKSAPAALGRGDIDAVADYVDLVPRTRKQSGVPVRAVQLGLPFYSSGLVAADRLAPELVDRVCEALVAALQRQRDNPEAGVASLLERYPDVDPADALEAWGLGEPNIFTEVPVGSMQAERWEETIAFTARAHGWPRLAVESVYRPERVGLRVPSA